MRSALWWLLPDEAMPLVIVGIGLAMILGLIAGRAAMGLLAILLITPLFAPFIEAAIASLPPWLALLILASIVLAFLRGVASLFLGRAAAAHMTGSLAADLVRFTVLACFLPLRIVAWLVRRI